MLGFVAPPRDDPRDDGVRLVGAAAALLQMPDFRFFHLAYRRWYGEDATDAFIERAFVPYMYRRGVPFWARHLAREVVARDREGALDPRDYGVQPLPPDPATRRKGALFGAILVLLMYGFCFAITTYQAAG